MKRLDFCNASLLALVLTSKVFIGLPTMAAATHREAVDGIAAIVNNEPILLSELEELRQMLTMQSPGFKNISATAQRREVLDRLIDDKIAVAKGKLDTTIKISEKDLSPRVEETYQQYVKQQGGEKALELALKQSTGLSPAQFKARMLTQMKDQAYRQRVQMKYVGDHEPSAQQVREFYARFQDSLPMQRDGLKISHIQIRVKAGHVLDSTSFARADSIVKRLDKGELFTKLASEVSDDPSKKDGGDIGFTRKGTLDPDYEKAAFALDAGDYTPYPIRSRFGWHVIKVTAKKDNEVRTSHILVRVIPAAEDTLQARAFADSLRKSLMAIGMVSGPAPTKGSLPDPRGEAFAKAARRHSDDRKTRELGGNLGWFSKDQLDESYKAAVDTLSEGAITNPLLSGDSWSIFRLDKQANERHLTLDEDWAQIAQAAKNWYLQQKLQTYVKKWREGIQVEDRLSSFTNLQVGLDEDDPSNIPVSSGAKPITIPVENSKAAASDSSSSKTSP